MAAGACSRRSSKSLVSSARTGVSREADVPGSGGSVSALGGFRFVTRVLIEGSTEGGLRISSVAAFATSVVDSDWAIHLPNL